MVKAELSSRWLRIQKASVRKLTGIRIVLDFEAETRLTLSNSLPYIKSRLAYIPMTSNKKVELPTQPRRIHKSRRILHMIFRRVAS